MPKNELAGILADMDPTGASLIKLWIDEGMIDRRFGGGYCSAVDLAIGVIRGINQHDE
jgi:hypothetical protein